MEYPPEALPTDRTDDTPTRGVLAPDLNAVAEAVNATVEVLGDEPQGSEASVEDRLATLDSTVEDVRDEAAVVELGYAEIIAEPAATTFSTLNDVPGLSKTVTVGTRPIEIDVSGTVYNDTTGGGSVIALVEDGVVIDQRMQFATGQGSLSFSPIHIHARRSPAQVAPGPHTYKVQYARAIQGATHVWAGAAPSVNTPGPFSLHIKQV